VYDARPDAVGLGRRRASSRGADTQTVWTAADVSPQLAVGRKQARNRLNDLAEQCLLNVETVGSTKVYWLSEHGREALAPD
jgi:predicted ArsR family transcriptional regulator